MKTNKFSSFLVICIACAICASCTSPCDIVWNEGAVTDGDREVTYTMDIQNPPKGTDWVIWFSQFRAPITMEEGSQGTIDHISGTLYLIRPTADTKGKTLTLKYKSRTLVAHNRAPEAFYLKENGKDLVRLTFTQNFQPSEDIKSFEYAHVQTKVEDMIPALKKVTRTGGDTTVKTDAEAEFVSGKPAGWYRITIGETTRIEAADADGAYYAGVTINNLICNAGGETVPAMVIEDWPDLGHRGVMLDVSRNFTKKDDVKTLIALISRYKANVLHLHFGDDEGWRIEIEGLPELTSYGAYRAIPVLNEDGSYSEPEALQMTYSATSGKDDEDAVGNGFFSRADFVEILKFANEHHVRVIPEFDTPGHSRAMIKSMEKRAELTGDTSCLLSEPEDVSEYVSVQDYTDNAINVALESTYTFISKVFDGLIAIYKEAGAPLPTIHIGGDEVPEGAWMGSPACKKLMAENGWDNPGQLYRYYINRVMDIAAAKGVKIAGWQDVAQNIDSATLEKMKENLEYTNFWTVSHGRDQLGYQFANEGLGVIMSSAPNTYLDFSYNRDKKERGHNWGGYVDERRTFSLLPYDIYRSVRWDDEGKLADISDADAGKVALTAKGRPNILGVQGQLWAETLRCFDHVTYYIFPKALGLFERGWNAEPVWAASKIADDPVFVADFNKFYSIIVDHEMPYYDSIGISYHKN